MIGWPALGEPDGVRAVHAVDGLVPYVDDGNGASAHRMGNSSGGCGAAEATIKLGLRCRRSRSLSAPGAPRSSPRSHASIASPSAPRRGASETGRRLACAWIRSGGDGRTDWLTAAAILLAVVVGGGVTFWVQHVLNRRRRGAGPIDLAPVTGVAGGEGLCQRPMRSSRASSSRPRSTSTPRWTMRRGRSARPRQPNSSPDAPPSASVAHHAAVQ
jgi:hypothetical protein